MSVQIRHASRVVLFDEDDRLFLFRFRDRGRDRPWWATPGGGVQHGESHEDAARRELWEELGVTNADIGSAVWTRETEFDFAGTWTRALERFYLLRLPNDRVRPGSVVDLPEENVTGWRWWELEDLASSTETIWPTRLALFARALLENGPGVEPIDVGV